EACKALLEEPEGGEVFGAAVVAVDRWDLRGVARVLDAFGGAPDLARGFASALGWTPFDRVQKLLPGLLAGRCPPALHWLGISACAAHRRDPGPALGYAILSSEPHLKARALRAAGELGRMDLLPEVRAELGSSDAGCRLWAAWTAALFGEPAAAQALWNFASAPGPHAERAACMAMRRMDPGVAYTWLYSLASAAPDPRVPLSAAAALGDPAIMPWLLESMKPEPTARLAGGAFTMITGINLMEEKLAAKPPEGFQSGPNDDPEEEDVSMDPDDSLPWPDAARVAAWWQRHAGEFKRGTRYLLGKPMTPDWLERVLRSGSQPARAAAALELSLRQPRRPVFEVRAPGFQQRRALGRM
ncbi:MAG: TIGR02270 family protein, partial [Polyangiaceae bacterium]|nr:TIGR02270 family protein [Polyangiaceae bacterium]